MLDFPSHDHIAVDLCTMNDFQTRTEVEYAPGRWAAATEMYAA